MGRSDKKAYKLKIRYGVRRKRMFCHGIGGWRREFEHSTSPATGYAAVKVSRGADARRMDADRTRQSRDKARVVGFGKMLREVVYTG